LHALALTAGLTLGPGAAEAAAHLEWRAPAECPATNEVQRRIGRLLDAGPVDAAKPPPDVTASVTRRGATYAMRFETRGPAARVRDFEAHDCDTLANTAALLFAIAVDPAAAGRVERLEPHEDADLQPTASTGQPAPPSPAPGPALVVASGPPARRSGGFVGLRPMLGGTLGPLPGVDGGPALAIAFARRLARVEAVGAYWLPRVAESSIRDGAGARVAAGWAAARGCVVPATTRVEMPLCAGLQLGAMQATGVGVARASTQRLWWVAVSAGPSLAVRLEAPVALWLSVDAVVPVSRPGFRIEGEGVVHRAAPAGAELFLGVEARIPVALRSRRRAATEPDRGGQEGSQ
jgi:hypothetical protein